MRNYEVSFKVVGVKTVDQKDAKQLPRRQHLRRAHQNIWTDKTTA